MLLYIRIDTKDIKVQLIGAVGLMLLLGAPWIFSGFGALSTVNPTDTHLSIKDGILEVIVYLVLFILESLFIMKLIVYLIH